MKRKPHIVKRIFWFYVGTSLLFVSVYLGIGWRLENTQRSILVVGLGLATILICGVWTFMIARRFQEQVEEIDQTLDRIARGKNISRIPADVYEPLQGLFASLGNTQLLLREREELISGKGKRIETVLESMVEGVIALDVNRRITFINSAASSLLTITAQEVMERRLIEVVRLPEIERTVSEVYRTGNSHKSECETIRGPRRILSVQCTPTALESDRGAVLVIRDMTELRALENMRRDFVTNVSHELKTPLASISLYAETLRLGAIDDSENRMRFIERIEEQAARLNQLILDLIELARIESGKQTYDKKEVDVREIARRRVQVFEEDARETAIELTHDVGNKPLIVNGDEQAIGTILDNLITNAFRYTAENGKVHVHCHESGGFVVMKVSDSGFGIAPEHQDRIFERFYRVDKARSSDLGGTGLGLSIVKHLAQSMGGVVSVESKVGHGSKFTVMLPIQDGKLPR